LIQSRKPIITFLKKKTDQSSVIKIPFENVKPHWMPYIAVKDPAEIVKKVEQYGWALFI